MAAPEEFVLNRKNELAALTHLMADVNDQAPSVTQAILPTTAIIQASSFHRAANALESIAKSQEKNANPTLVVNDDGTVEKL